MRKTGADIEIGTLARYNEMRDFDRTEEPSGRKHRSKSGRDFVVQKHAATRLHYDFRLELDGVLLSWAVPKGPSLSTKDRRLAVRTEDHPDDYRDFEGTIPKGQYGGGPVIVWDRGTWTPIGDPHAGLAKGRLDFTLDGEKLHGRFLLVRTREDARGKASWLLMKRSDEFADEAGSDLVAEMPASVLTGRTIEDVVAGVPIPKPAARRKKARAASKPRRKAPKRTAGVRPKRATRSKAPGGTPTGATPLRTPDATKRATAKRDPFPRFGATKPQLATLVGDVPKGDDWIFEIKYDGYRALASVDGGDVRIASRNGKDWTEAFGPIAGALSRVRATSAVFDGEVAYVMPDGKTDFQKLQNALGSNDANERARLVYFVFDLLYYDGADLTREPLRFRKEKLRTILAGEGPPLRFGDHVTSNGERFFDEACKLGLEGIIAKRADRPYVHGRTKEWLKIKCQNRQELAIVGFTPGKGGRKGLGALLLATHVDDEGARGAAKHTPRYRYAGKVGTGFSQASLATLERALGPLVVDEPPVANPPRIRDATWVKPALVAQVRFTEWTREGALRHPSFEGLRSDKRPAEATREIPRETPSEPARKAKPTRGKAKRPSRTTHASATTTRARAADGRVLVGGVGISHADRVIDETSGATKLDLARYHEAIAPLLLAYAKDRPLMLLRCPNRPLPKKKQQDLAAKAGAGCFVQKHANRGLQGTKFVEGTMIEGEEALFVRDPRGVIELAQMNCLEIHGWGSRLPKWGCPDWIVFDLDPDEGLPFARVVAAARELRDDLASIGLTTFVKTTGGKGLHVVVPLARRHDWATVRTFSERIARVMATKAPSRYVANMSKKARKGKIFVDYLRNAQGATAILPYSARARPGLPVAMPIGWDELDGLDPAAFDVLTAVRHVETREVDPWADLLTTKQNLSKAVLAAIGAET